LNRRTVESLKKIEISLRAGCANAFLSLLLPLGEEPKMREKEWVWERIEVRVSLFNIVTLLTL
jgi:hypothetical protein